MMMLIRMARTQKVAADGFTVITTLKDEVYAVPDELGRLLVDDKAATVVEGPATKRAVAPDRMLAGRTQRPPAERF
jgi:hypothetical protein